MKLVVQPAARDHIHARGGAVYVWAERRGCCRSPVFLLESATEPPAREFELVHAADAVRVFASAGLVEPDELHIELDRRDRLRAYWNCQGWIG